MFPWLIARTWPRQERLELRLGGVAAVRVTKTNAGFDAAMEAGLVDHVWSLDVAYWTDAMRRRPNESDKRAATEGDEARLGSAEG